MLKHRPVTLLVEGDIVSTDALVERRKGTELIIVRPSATNLYPTFRFAVMVFHKPLAELLPGSALKDNLFVSHYNFFSILKQVNVSPTIFFDRSAT